jgi:uncharacterized membrane protein SirB2
MATAAISLIGFVLRFWWVKKNSPMMSKKLVKILPHINDTVLLVAAISLSIMSGLYPLSQNWLTAKVFLLVGYVVAGIFALKRAKTEQGRLVAFAIALTCILLIFAIASIKPGL